MTAKVLVLGARGRLGLALVRAFAKNGWEVLAQVRPGKTLSEPGVKALALEPQDTVALAQAAHGASVVINALNPPYPRWAVEAEALMQSAIDMAQALDACLMFPGNVYNFGAAMPTVLDESTPMHPSTRKGAIRVRMEQRLNASALRTVIIRAGDYFGSGTGSWFDLAYVKDIHKGKLTLPGAVDVPTPWAYVPDFAQTFVAVAQRQLSDPAALSQHSTFCFPGYQVSGRDWANLLEPLAREQGWLVPGQPIKIAKFPWGLIKAFGWAVPMFREILEMRYLPSTPHVLDGRKLREFLGEIPQTPLPIALRAALRDLGKLKN